jgi:hypothetical protein
MLPPVRDLRREIPRAAMRLIDFDPRLSSRSALLQAEKVDDRKVVMVIPFLVL